jgi:isoleucyl-tRNA synthetase
MFKELTDKLSYPEVEKEILKFWKENRIFEKSISSREGKPGFTFYEGPPTANGRPGIHHVMSRTLKDLVCRYKTMRGYQVHRKAGWDTHGLPVEIEVEKQLGIKNKSEILSYGVEKFNEECKKSVWKYKADWERMTRMMGYWVNLDDPYITFHNEYIESVWWSLKQFYDRGMIYRGHKIQPYCYRCGTVLSSHEVALGYQNVAENSVYIKFKLRSLPNAFILSWTTTPWTLPGNIALAVGDDIEYSKVKVGDELWILATARLEILKEAYEVVETMKGKDLVGLEYIPLFDIVPLRSEKSYKIYTADFVTTTEGTGVVHTAVMYGEDDYRLGKRIGLPTHHTVDETGKFTNDVKELAGLPVKEKATEKAIFNHLKATNTMVRIEQYAHDYPFCWRCSTPLLYYARDSWFIRTTAYAQQMIDLNKTINWIPSEVGAGRFGNWLEENKDWALSRDRFWGTALPIWVCASCGKQECIGSIAELMAHIPQLATASLNLHKPFVDQWTWSCTCSGTMKRTPELIDVWYDSGAMPFAQWHYPFENKETFERNYPGDYISEGIDQTRGWFYTLHAIGTFLFGKPAYKNCLVNELILDKGGQKMSKTKGNTVDPFFIMEKYGADTTRWYLVTTSPPWKPTLFDEEGLAEVQRKFFGTLVNTYSFFALYANIDRFSYAEPTIPVRERPEIDRWIISELNSLVKRYLSHMDAYDVTKASRSVSEFTIDQLSNWYVRRNRRRFWSKTRPVEKSEKGKDKAAAYQTLYECLIAVCKLTAPFAPFLSEQLYRNLNSVTRREGIESVHLAHLPAPEKHLIDAELESRMERAEKIVMLVRSMRMKSNLKVRQPLKRIILPITDEKERDIVHRMESVILDEINVKKIEYVNDESGIVKKSAKANFKSIGPKFGKSVKQVAERIMGMTPAEIAKLEQSTSYELHVNGGSVWIGREDVEIIREDIQGWLVESDGGITVALDTELSDELVTEGLAREFVNRIQNMRKDAGFQVTDRIAIFYHGSEKLHRALQLMNTYIKSETLAVDFSDSFSQGEYSSKLDINGEEVEVGIERRPQD